MKLTILFLFLCSVCYSQEQTIKIESVTTSSSPGSTIPIGRVTEAYPYTSDLNFRSTSRDGYYLVDDYGNDADILTPYFYRTTSTPYAYIIDSSALDINTTDFTLCGWVNDITVGTSGNVFYFGKGIQGSVAGEYSIYSRSTTRNMAAAINSTETAVLITSTVVSNTAGWKFVLVDINQTTKKVRFFINNVQIGSDASYTGTIPVLDGKYKFYLGGESTATGVHADTYTGHMAGVRLYRRLLTPTEQTALYNFDDVSGALLHIPCSEIKLHDISGNNYHPTTSNVTIANIAYNEYGSKQGLNVGYDIYKSPGLADVHIPLKSDSTSIDSVTLATTYYKDTTIYGDTVYHNMFNSMILFDGNNFDRSNTIIYSDYARADNTYYVAATPKAWHISEMEILKLKLFANPGYTAKIFPKFTAHRGKLLEILSYKTNKTSSRLKTVLDSTNNYDTWHDIDYYYDTRNIVCTRNNYMLIFDVSDHTLKFSTNDGDNYIDTIDLTGVANSIKFAYIYDDGKLIFGTEQKLFYSHDSLATYTESTVLDTLGNAFTPPTYDAFTRFMPDNYFKIGSLEMPVWGNYSTRGGTYNDEINCFYTIDGGETIKSFLYFNGNGTATSISHIHTISYNSADSSFWIQTGDGVDNNTGNWYKYIYDVDLDDWSGSLINTGDINSYFKTNGMAFNNGDVIFGCDSYTFGIWKSSYAEITDSTKFEKLYNIDIDGTLENETYILALLADEDGVIIATIQDNPVLIISTDYGESWFTHTLTGYPTLTSNAGLRFGTIYPKNSEGYYLIHIVEDGEVVSNDWTLGDILMLKIEKP